MSDAERKPVVGAWEVLESNELYRNPYFAFRRETCMLPDERIMPAYYVWDMVDCERVGEPTLDPFEDIEVELVEVADFLDMFRQGRPIHALMMASLTLAMPAMRKFCVSVPDLV